MKQDRAALEDRDVSIGQPRHLPEGLMREMLGIPSAKWHALDAVGQPGFFQCPTHTYVTHIAPRRFGNPIEGGENQVGHLASPFVSAGTAPNDRHGLEAAARRQADRVQTLEVDHSLEAAPDHALGVEGHCFGIHHLGKTLVLHHLRVDAVASGARLVDDIGEHYGLTGLLLDATREGCSLSPFDVVGDAFAELQRAVLAPDLARLARHPPVGCKLLLWNRHDKSIDVAHGGMLRGLRITQQRVTKSREKQVIGSPGYRAGRMRWTLAPHTSSRGATAPQ